MLVLAAFAVSAAAQEAGKLGGYTTVELRKVCVDARQSFDNQQYANATQAYNSGACVAVMHVWMDMIDGYITPNKDGDEVIRTGGDGTIGELVSAFIDITNAKPELLSKSPAYTLAYVASVRGWMTIVKRNSPTTSNLVPQKNQKMYENAYNSYVRTQ